MSFLGKIKLFFRLLNYTISALICQEKNRFSSAAKKIKRRRAKAGQILTSMLLPVLL